MSEQFDQAYWNDRYGQRDDVWSGAPNPVLVAETLSLPAGSALDIGCGEGADAIWLASRGWQVTATDFSAVALERAAARSHRAGGDPAESAAIAARIDWQLHDFTEWTPPAGAYDLVSAQFMHLPSEPRTSLFRALAAAVAPGGTLLLVGHDVSDLHSSAHHPDPDLFFRAEDVAATLDPALWLVELAGPRVRAAIDPDGQALTLTDTVLRARRR